MLSHYDADLVRRDAALPGLATLLDPEKFASAIGAQLPGFAIGSVQNTYVRYKPGTGCLVGYIIEIGGESVPVTAEAFRPDAVDKLTNTQARPNVSTAFGPGRIALADRSVIVSFYPNDDRLPALRLLSERETRRKLLGKLLPVRDDLRDASMDAMRYKPERRFVAKLSVGGVPRAVLKVYSRSGYESAQANARAFKSTQWFRRAARLGRSERHGLLALEWLPGRLLAEAIGDPTFAVQSVEAVGDALARLHAQEARRLTLRSRFDEAASLAPLADWIAHVYPTLANRTRRLGWQIAERIADLPVIDRPLHGDFYAKQVLLNEGGVGFIDFDEAFRGDPAHDLGLFLAHLESDSIRGRIEPRTVEPLRESFLTGYRSVSECVTASRIALYTAAGLLRLTPHPFRNREPDWPDKMAAVVERAEALLTAATTPDLVQSRDAGTGAPVIDPYGVTQDKEMPFLAAALCPTRVERELHGLIGQAHVKSIRVARYKPGRRCLVEYELAGPHTAPKTLIGKARAKGVDHRTLAHSRSLRQSGFFEQNPNGVFVPEPVGIVPAFGMWLQWKVPGVPTTRLLAQADGIDVARRVAEAAYELHQARMPAEREHSVSDELAILDKLVISLARERPAFAKRLDRLREGCHRLGASMPVSGKTGIHRDFYPDQVLIDGTRICLLDFDLFCTGDPALDIGNFLGHVTELSLRTFGDPNALADRESALVERYVELAGEGCRPAVRGYAVLTLARHVALSTRFVERRAFTERLLGLCEKRLEEFPNPARRPHTSFAATGGQL